MSAIVEQIAQCGSAGNEVVHISRHQQFARHHACLTIVLQSLIQALLLQAFVFKKRAPRIAKEVGECEAEVTIGEIGHVCRTRLLEDGRDKEFRVTFKQTIGPIGRYHHQLAIEVGLMQITIDIEVGNGCEGEIDIRIVVPQVDAILSVVELHVNALRHDLPVFPPDDGQRVVDIIGHTGLHHPHHVRKVIVMVALENILFGINRSGAAGAGQFILAFGGLHHLYRRARVNHALEVADADIGHAGHVIVEAQRHHALWFVLGIYDGHHTIHIVLHIHIWHIRNHHRVVDACGTRCHRHRCQTAGHHGGEHP